MRYSTEIKQNAINLYRTLGNTHIKKLGIHPGTVYHRVRTIIPEERKQKNARGRANNRAISILNKNGPMSYHEAIKYFSDELLLRLLEDEIIKKISKKYGKLIHSVYFLKGQEKTAKEKLDSIINKLSKFYPIAVAPVLPLVYTEQEKQIAEVLKQNGIPFEHSRMLEKGNICPDFCIPSAKEPKIVVQARNSNAKARSIYYNMSKSMGFDGFVIKKYYPDAKLISLINGSWLPSGENRLKESYDHIINDHNLSKLIQIVKKHLLG